MCLQGLVWRGLVGCLVVRRGEGMRGGGGCDLEGGFDEIFGFGTVWWMEEVRVDEGTFLEEFGTFF